jgi:hypothetical protein
MVLKSSSAPYGAILEGSGRLTLKGRMLPVVHSAIRRDAREDIDETIEFMNMNGQSYKIRVEFDASEPEPEDETSPEDDVMLFEFLSCYDEKYKWLSRGLVLRWLRGEIFSRLGVFEFNSYRDYCESRQEWNKRVDRDHIWFKDCVPTVLEII